MTLLNNLTPETSQQRQEITKELFLLVIQDQRVQQLMNDLDLPADRANLFEATWRSDNALLVNQRKGHLTLFRKMFKSGTTSISHYAIHANLQHKKNYYDIL